MDWSGFLGVGRGSSQRTLSQPGLGGQVSFAGFVDHGALLCATQSPSLSAADPRVLGEGHLPEH